MSNCITLSLTEINPVYHVKISCRLVIGLNIDESIILLQKKLQIGIKMLEKRKRKLYSMNTLALQVLIENMQLVKLVPVLNKVH